MTPPLPLRARIAIRVQRAVDWILDPWLQLIPDDPDPEVEDLIERVQEALREEGRREVREHVMTALTIAEYAEHHGGRDFDA